MQIRVHKVIRPSVFPQNANVRPFIKTTTTSSMNKSAQIRFICFICVPPLMRTTQLKLFKNTINNFLFIILTNNLVISKKSLYICTGHQNDLSRRFVRFFRAKFIARPDQQNPYCKQAFNHRKLSY